MIKNSYLDTDFRSSRKCAYEVPLVACGISCSAWRSYTFQRKAVLTNYATGLLMWDNRWKQQNKWRREASVRLLHTCPPLNLVEIDRSRCTTFATLLEKTTIWNKPIFRKSTTNLPVLFWGRSIYFVEASDSHPGILRIVHDHWYHELNTGRDMSK